MIPITSRSRTTSFTGLVPRSIAYDEDAKREEAVVAVASEKRWALMSKYLSTDVEDIEEQIARHVEYTLACTRFDFDINRCYMAAALSVRDRLIESWNDTNNYLLGLEPEVKRVYYLSMEYLVGRTLQNALLNMDLDHVYAKALRELGYRLEDVVCEEKDAALGNGGLGRLAACFLDSMATLDLPAWGYGLRYTYGMFAQSIVDKRQAETPDYWLTRGNPWEIERLDVCYPVQFYGSVRRLDAAAGKSVAAAWEGGEQLTAVAYDNPVPGFDTYNTINLRLWKAVPASEFSLDDFNAGDYMKAVEARQRAEMITSVLYPNDSTYNGRELRLKQQYFFVAATLADIIRRFKKRGEREWADFPKLNAVQLNDTHPSLGIAELQRILVDVERLPWEAAWDITRATFSYTNHTILPEALEAWPVDMLGHLLPRHLEIIYEINWRFLQEVEARWPGSVDKKRELSLVAEGFPKSIRMAWLSIVGSHTINGVAAIHSSLLKTKVFPSFYKLWPHKFQNKTNGVTPRRWLALCNPQLASLISDWLGSDAWVKNLALLADLRPVADNELLQAAWREVKLTNKRRLAAAIEQATGIVVRADALFDVQVKRIHEYKRQLMNILYVIHRYKTIKAMSEEERAAVVPRVILFGGKAAPAYVQAKRIIGLINEVAAVVNGDEDVGDLLKVIFFPNYNVSNAEIIIPASELSQHISTAGMEASGTSNMKFTMNGGLIIGTMDGANIEIAEQIGKENMFVFGAETAEVEAVRLQQQFAPPRPHCAELAAVIADLVDGKFGPSELVDELISAIGVTTDYYLVSYDFPAYLAAQAEVDALYKDQAEWTRRSILATAGTGVFSSDRTIQQYAEDIWRVKPARRPDPRSAPGAMERALSTEDLRRGSSTERLKALAEAT